MENVLLQLGLTDKETAIYLLLLASPGQTAQQVADQTDIKRTNVYRILDNLLSVKLIIRDDSPISTFSAAEPKALRDILDAKQQQLKQTAESLSAAMRSFRSQYSLSRDKPGVYYMAGSEGLERLLVDMVSSQTEVLLVASNDLPTDEQTLSRFWELLLRRRDAGVKTRALFHSGPHETRIREQFGERGMDVHFIDSSPFTGEVVIYEDNVVFTVYNPSIIVTVLTNASVTATMRTLFEQSWRTTRE